MSDIVTIFDKPIFLCVIETGHLAIYYISKNRTANIAYIKRRLPISTFDDLIKHFEYDDCEERLFKALTSENKERFELFLIFSRRDYILPGSKLVELVTDDISEGELR